MLTDEDITYLFIRFINKTLINEKLRYVRDSSKKNIEFSSVNIEKLKDRVEKEALFNELSDIAYLNFEEYIEDYKLSCCIEKLTKIEKLIVFRRFVEEKKDPEIAKELGITSQAVSKRRRNILKKIRMDLY